MLEPRPIFRGKYLNSNYVHILFPFIAYTNDDLFRKLETIFQNSVKVQMCRIFGMQYLLLHATCTSVIT